MEAAAEALARARAAGEVIDMSGDTDDDAGRAC
jgi:hypothetical protein